MRSNQNNRVKTLSAAKASDKRPFCGVCQKAGKPESVFRGHFIKSKPGPDGVVICPTILSIECRFCHELGHSASEEHCPALREKALRRKEWEREDRDRQKELQMKKSKVEEIKKVVVLKKTTLNNRFASAFEDSDDDEETSTTAAAAAAPAIVIQSPVPIVVPKPLAESVCKFSYASMLKREEPIKKPIVKQYFVPLVAVSASQHHAAPKKIIEFEDEPEILPIKVEVKKVDVKASKLQTKIEALKEFYKPIPLEIDEEEDEFEFDVNFMSKKGYVCNDAW